MSASPADAGREARTLRAMIRVYCGGRHGAPTPCAECARLEAYALGRLARCRYLSVGPGARKPVCALCPTHCYGRREREAIRAVMRYAGPRMLLRHPILAAFHLLRRARGVPS